MKTYKGLITKLLPNEIFVFGSNPQGRHGAGAAKVAMDKFGARYGQGIGIQGNSYGIVTKNLEKHAHPSISRDNIRFQIGVLYSFAKMRNQCTFYVAYSADGVNLNGYTNEDMAAMFASAGTIPDNVVFEEGFSKLIF